MDANNPYRGRRGLRFGKSGRVRVVRGFARGGAVSLDGLTRKASREHDKITEEAFRDSDGVPADDAHHENGFARGGTVLRKKERDWAGQARTRPNVDVSAWWRSNDATQMPGFDHRGSKLPRVTATRRVGHEKD